MRDSLRGLRLTPAVSIMTSRGNALDNAFQLGNNKGRHMRIVVGYAITRCV
jgi:hypothetical protein